VELKEFKAKLYLQQIAIGVIAMTLTIQENVDQVGEWFGKIKL
tara:strand:+ start:291 stop:419 length:129 start_codon:yes stop_codon:yes gene_type:complete